MGTLASHWQLTIQLRSVAVPQVMTLSCHASAQLHDRCVRHAPLAHAGSALSNHESWADPNGADHLRVGGSFVASENTPDPPAGVKAPAGG